MEGKIKVMGLVHPQPEMMSSPPFATGAPTLSQASPGRPRSQDQEARVTVNSAHPAEVPEPLPEGGSPPATSRSL